MGYPDHAKGYQFFGFERGARNLESINAKNLELDVIDSFVPSNETIIST